MTEQMLQAWERESTEQSTLLKHPDAQRLIMEKRLLDEQSALLDGRVAKVSEVFYNMNLVKKFSNFEKTWTSYER